MKFRFNYLRRLNPLVSQLWRHLSHHQVPPLTLFSTEENLLKETVKKFSNDVISPLVRKMDNESKLDKNVIRGLFDNGLMAVEVPHEYGGIGATFFSLIIIIEEMSKIDPSVGVFCYVHNTLVSKMIQNYGSEEQKFFYLPKFPKNLVGAFCLTETESGSNAFALKTTAKKCGDSYVINGSKHLITNVEHAGVLLVMANVDVSLGYKGITCFIVDAQAEGVHIGRNEDKLGIRASSTCPIKFDNVHVPASSVLGQVGHGYKYAMQILNEGRIGIAAQMVGLAQGCLDHTVPYLKERKQFGRRVWDFQAVQHQASELSMQIKAARLLTYEAARLKEFGHQSYVKKASMAKLLSSNVATYSTSKCVELLGGVGFSKEFPVEKFYRDCKSGTIYAGTSNIQLNTIAKLIEREYK